MQGFQTVRRLKNAKAQITKRIVRELAKARTVDILGQQDCRREPFIACHAMNTPWITLAPREVHGKGSQYMRGTELQSGSTRLCIRRLGPAQHWRRSPPRTESMQFSTEPWSPSGRG